MSNTDKWKAANRNQAKVLTGSTGFLKIFSQSRHSRIDSMHATEVCSASWQHESLTLHISLTSTHVILLSYNPKLFSGLSMSCHSEQHPCQENRCLAGWLNEQMERRTDRWISGYICLCSSANPLQWNSNPVHLHWSILCFYVSVKQDWFGVWLWAWDRVKKACQMDCFPGLHCSFNLLFLLFTI